MPKHNPPESEFEGVVNLCPRCGEQRIRKKMGAYNDGSPRYIWICPPCRKEDKLNYRNRNPERFRELSLEQTRRAYTKNREKALERKRKKYHENKDLFQRRNREQREKNWKKHYAKQQEWRKQNPEKTKEKGRKGYVRRKHRKKAIAHVSTLTRDQYRALRKLGTHCYYCGRYGSGSKTKGMHLDHVIPLGDGPDSVENLVPACLPCNASKGNKPLEAWALSKGIHLFPMPKLPLITSPQSATEQPAVPT